MSSLLRCSLCLAFYGLLSWLMVEAINPASLLKVRPTPVPVVPAAGILGTWFVQSHVAPCSWQGSSQFTDWQFDMVDGEQPGIQYSVDQWSRLMHGVCTNIRFPIIADSTVPGKCIIKDPIGDVLTGECAVVRYDLDSYIIFWGCTKPSVIANQCADPFLDISTRDKFPRQPVWNNIDTSLMQVFGLRLADMPRVNHTQAPCVPSVPYGPKG